MEGFTNEFSDYIPLGRMILS